MSMNNERAARCIIDIETAPIADAAAYVEMPSAPSNYTDPVKIAAYGPKKQAEQIAKAGLDPDLCRIVAVGWWRESTPEPSVLTADGCDEDLMILNVWEALDRCSIAVGKNILGFDFQVLIRRSQYLGLPYPSVNLDRYRTPHIDLQEVLSFHGRRDWRTLDFYIKRFSIECPDDLYTGKDIGALVEAGNFEAVAHHCRCDLLKTARLAARLGYFTLPAPIEVGAF